MQTGTVSAPMAWVAHPSRAHAGTRVAPEQVRSKTRGAPTIDQACTSNRRSATSVPHRWCIGVEIADPSTRRPDAVGLIVVAMTRPPGVGLGQRGGVGADHSCVELLPARAYRVDP